MAARAAAAPRWRRRLRLSPFPRSRLRLYRGIYPASLIPTTMFGVHARFHTHARGQRHAVVAVDGKPDRQTLHHFHPVARRILRRQEREAGTGARAGTEDMAGEAAAR